jgi:creatinine amidohydrolase
LHAICEANCLRLLVAVKALAMQDVEKSLGVFTQFLMDYCQSLIQHGFKRFFVVTGHVGNVPAVSSIAYDLQGSATFAMVDVWRFLAKHAEGISESDCIPEGHASEIGTSILMALRPELVDMEQAVKEVPSDRYAPQVGLFTYPALTQVTKSGVIGDPFLASAEKGKKIITKAIEALCNFFGGI